MAWTASVLDALGFAFGAAHIELVDTAEGLAVIEFNARGGPFLRTRGAGVPSRRLPLPTHATVRRQAGKRRM